jgi:hypothetical protein
MWCGNRLSLKPQEPIGPDVELDVPVEYDPSADGAEMPYAAWLPRVVHEGGSSEFRITGD